MADTLSATEDLLDATVGDHVRITAVLGRGPSAVVYEATDDTHGDVVVKVWNEARAADDEALLRMVRETRALSTPPHPNVATVHAAGALPDGRPYVVMQRLLGPTFAELLDRGQPVAAARVAELVSGVAKALDHAHRAGVVHGALTPKNVVLTISVESGEVAKVLDLGTSSLRRSVPPDGEDAEHVAPETRATGSVAAEADVFALAVLAYRLLTGMPPSGERGADGARTGSGVMLGAELDEVLARGLAADPKQRPWPVTELLRELRAAAARSSIAPAKAASASTGPPPRTLQGVGRDKARSHDTLRDQAGSRGDQAGSRGDQAGSRGVASASGSQRAVPRPLSSPSIPRPITSSMPPRPPSSGAIPRPITSSMPPRPPSSSSIRKPEPRPRPPSSPALPAVPPPVPMLDPDTAIELIPETPTVVTPPMTISSVLALPAPIVLLGPDPDPVLARPPSAPPPSEPMRETIPLDQAQIELMPPIVPLAPPPNEPFPTVPLDQNPEGLAEVLHAHGVHHARIASAPSTYDEPSEALPAPKSRFPIAAVVIGFVVIGGGITAAYFVHRSMTQSPSVTVATVAPPRATAPNTVRPEQGERSEPVVEGRERAEPVAPTQPTTEPLAPTQPSAAGGPGAEDIAEALRWMESGRARRAEPLFRRALRADPNNLDAWRGLARASERLTRRRKAIWAWEQFLRRAPNAPDAADIRARIARLQGEDPAGTAGGGGDEEPTDETPPSSP